MNGLLRLQQRFPGILQDPRMQDPQMQTPQFARPQGLQAIPIPAVAPTAPGMLARQAPQAGQAQEPRQSRFQRFAGAVGPALGQMFGGMDDPNLSAEENQRARRQALLMAGFTGMGASTGAPGGPAPSFGQVIGQMGMAGQQVGMGERQRIMEQNALKAQQDAVAQRMQEIQAMFPEGQPPNIEALRALGIRFAAEGDADSSQAIMRLLEMMQPEAEIDPMAQLAESLPRDLVGHLVAQGVNPFTDQIDPEDPRVQRAQSDWMQGKAPASTNISLGLGERTDQQLIPVHVSMYEGLQEEGLRNMNLLNSIEALRSLLDSGTSTGGLQNLTLGARQIAASVGLANAETLAPQEVFQGLSNQLALLLKNPNMTGQMSDRDIIFLQQQATTLANTPAGNRLLLDIHEIAARRAMEIADLADQYLEAKGDMFGFNAFLRDWSRNNTVRPELDEVVRRVRDISRSGQGGGMFDDLIPGNQRGSSPTPAGPLTNIPRSTPAPNPFRRP